MSSASFKDGFTSRCATLEQLPPISRLLPAAREICDPVRNNQATASKKKADVAEHPEVFDHVGLLFNGPPGMAELPFI